MKFILGSTIAAMALLGSVEARAQLHELCGNDPQGCVSGEVENNGEPGVVGSNLNRVQTFSIPNYVGVFGYGDTGDGVRGHSSASGAAGVSGVNLSTSGNAFGVFGTTSSPSGFAIYAAGNLAYSGSLTHQSDARLKEEIRPIDNGLARLLKLRGVTFRWKDPAKHGGATAVQTGFIAQEVEKEFPTWVREDSDGFKMVSTDGMDAMLVEGVRGLKAENDALRERVAKLEHPPMLSMASMGGGVCGVASAVALLIASLVMRLRRSERTPLT